MNINTNDLIREFGDSFPLFDKLKNPSQKKKQSTKNFLLLEKSETKEPESRKEFEVTEKTVDKKSKDIIIFTDGSCMKKPNQEPKCGYGIHFPNNEFNDISEPFTNGELTNQRAELHAIYKGIKKVTTKLKFDSLNIYTDSEYSIKSLTIWIKNWKKNNWKNAAGKPVANQDIISKIDEYLQKHQGKIFFHHIRSHTGKKDFYSLGNEKADKLATHGALS
jgi:ribonuclease HI